jgi:hypothetical protein
MMGFSWIKFTTKVREGVNKYLARSKSRQYAEVRGVEEQK